jgi:1,2-dihydroxy-3-keto-5-methylthiopentene dioxygenase
MRSYYFDDLPGDQRLPHDYVPSRPVSIDKLRAIGLHYWSIPIDNHQVKIDEVAQERGYKNRDVINVTREGLGDVRISMSSGIFYVGADVFA